MPTSLKSVIGGGVPLLGQIIQLNPSLPDDVILDGKGFIRNGFVTQDFAPELTPPSYSTFAPVNVPPLGNLPAVSSGCAADTKDGTTIAPTSRTNFIRTTDDWDTFQTINPQIGGISTTRPLVLALGNGVWLAIPIWDNSSGMFVARSIDDGLTWSSIDMTVFGSSPNFTDASHNGAGTVMVLRSGMAFVSTNYGLTFTQGGVALNGFDNSFGSLWWVGGANWIARNRTNEYWRSTNNGSSWTQLTTMPQFLLGTGASGVARKNAVNHDVTTGLTWAFSSNSAWISSNSGTTWTLAFTMPTPVHPNAPVNYGGGLWLKYINTTSIAFSENNGLTWTTRTGVLGLLVGEFFKSAGSTPFLRPQSSGPILKAVPAFGVGTLSAPDANTYYVRYK